MRVIPFSAHGAEPQALSFARYLPARFKGNVELAYRAKRDMMTDLYNKNSFTKDINLSLTRSGSTSFLLILDIDNFKGINDTYGHPVGDRGINAVAELLNAHFSHYDLVGRLGGDKFSVFAENIAREEMLEATEPLC